MIVTPSCPLMVTPRMASSIRKAPGSRFVMNLLVAELYGTIQPFLGSPSAPIMAFEPALNQSATDLPPTIEVMCAGTLAAVAERRSTSCCIADAGSSGSPGTHGSYSLASQSTQ